MDSIPIDILHNILSNLHISDRSFKIYDSRKLYNLRIVNKSFKNYIDNIKNLIIQMIDIILIIMKICLIV